MKAVFKEFWNGHEDPDQITINSLTLDDVALWIDEDKRDRNQIAYTIRGALKTSIDIASVGRMSTLHKIIEGTPEEITQITKTLRKKLSMDEHKSIVKNDPL